MAQKDVVDMRQFVQREIAHAGAGVDQDVVIKQKGRGAAAGRDRAGAAEDANVHGTMGAVLAGKISGEGRTWPRRGSAWCRPPISLASRRLAISAR
jgi:hypothetical protein